MHRVSVRSFLSSSRRQNCFRCSNGLPTPSVAFKSFQPISRSIHHIYRPSKPLQFPPGHHTLLPLVLTSNNLVLPQDPWHSQEPLSVGSRTASGSIAGEERIVPFLVSHDPSEKPVGWLLPEVAAAISRDHLRHFQRDSASPWEVRYFEDGASSHTNGEVVHSVAFADWVNEGGRHARTMHLERMILEWRRKKVFAALLKDWNDEPYPVFNHLKSPSSLEEPLAFAIERAALPIFGLPNFGCMLTAYVYNPETDETKLWIPRRSKTKKNWPGRLDVTVGGGVRLGDTALATILRESSEEALLDADYLSSFIVPVGTIPFPHRSAHSPSSSSSFGSSSSASPCSSAPLSGYILPGLYYTYEIALPLDMSVRPQVNALDGEVESFELMDIEEVLKNLLEGKFKSSSAMAIVDFLIRHGFVTEDSDSRYAEVCRGLRTDVGLPAPWRKIA